MATETQSSKAASQQIVSGGLLKFHGRIVHSTGRCVASVNIAFSPKQADVSLLLASHVAVARTQRCRRVHVNEGLRW